MAERQRTAIALSKLTRSLPHETIFQALPALDSPDYLERIRTAPGEDLPPEVLAKAFRQLPPGCDASRATLERLFRRREGAWDHLGPLVAFARRQRVRLTRDEYEDLVQDALRRILEILPTERGRDAELAWHSFCRRELIEAWRERYGRRGERIPPEDVLPEEDDAPGKNPLLRISVPPPWHAILSDNNVAKIEAVVRRVLEDMDDDFHKAVAQESWLKDHHPRVSGELRPGEDPPLTGIFLGKSRFQIMRALRHVNSQLAAALLAEPSLEWTAGLSALLRQLKQNVSFDVISAPDE